jgi:hypothetical protein
VSVVWRLPVADLGDEAVEPRLATEHQADPDRELAIGVSVCRSVVACTIQPGYPDGQSLPKKMAATVTFSAL